MASGTQSIVRTRSFKGYLSPAGHRNLGDCLDQLTWLWNLALDQRKTAWTEREESVSYYDQCKQLTALRRRDPAKWDRFAVYAQRSALQRLDRAYKRFFAQGGYPRFKGERGVRSFELTQFGMVRTNGRWSWLKVKGIGRIRFRGDPPGGDIRAVRVVRTARRVRVQFLVEQEVPAVTDDRPMVGIDLGIKSRVALSTGETAPGVKLDRRELKRRQRRLAKAKRGGRNRGKRRAELAREHQRVAERERGALHELTANLVKRVSASFAVEDLQIGNMVRNRRLSRSIHEQQWGALIGMLAYKAESAGGRVVRVAPHHTSQECSGCGQRQAVSLSVRVYRCGCGLVMDRDVNAARNVLQRGVASLPGGADPGRAEQADQAGEVVTQVLRKAG
ncbi:MAG: transposase [Gemmatimonadota bacterium]|nr:transposase [Gemmatimonadota bacterium]